MKMVVNFVQVVVLFLQIFAEPTSGTLYQESMIQKHEQWMHLHGRVYQDIAEKEMRFKIFMENVEFIEAFNNKNNGSYKLGINAFADLTTEEFRDSILVKYDHDDMSYMKNLSAGKGGGRETSSFRYGNVTAVPNTVDWRTKGAVTPIKNQGHCGSCWAFSAIAATEGINKIKRGKLISLSEQEILDCDRKAVCAQGCNGGYIEHAFKFMIKNKGITSENNYPYSGTDETCKNRAKKTDPQKIKIKIKGFEKVPINSEEDLMKAVAHQPVSVYIDANSKHFKSYSSGIFDGPCGGKRYNHCVTVVGYGVGEEKEGDDGRRRTKYWVVKNSWGKNWGEKGYIKIKRGVKSKRGLCGIAVRPSYPTV